VAWYLRLLAACVCRAQDGSSGGGDASTRLLSTLLTEMDGMELATGVLVLAATNRWEGRSRENCARQG
jgi:ATP-dependent Zn protease